ncbi:MAG: acetylxylan esterase [Planctomycetaceae bacterium]
MRTRLILSAAVTLLLVSTCPANSPRVLPEGKRPNDARLGPQKDLNAYFPFTVPATKEVWEARARELKRRILVSTGLWPMPQRTPLRPVIFGKVNRPGFSVEKVYFESLPGHFITGLLYRPAKSAGKGRHPAVLCPHGHGGRLQDYGEGKMDALIKSGGEKFRKSGRFPKLARCAQLARMGCVTFIFDMEGYADSQQIGMQVAHRLQKQRPHMNSPEGWGFISTQAELRLQSIMGLQTWSSIRCLDFLAGLPDVDPKRIGVTGGSGGGTQTILLCAIDPRPVVAFPNGMVSTSMQGGCTCENCCLLRIGTGNVELAALFAPKPQGMTAANDWTKEMMTKGYPQLRQLYGLYGKRDHVLCRSLVQFPHNYNYVSRGIMYNLFNRHLGLGLQEPVIETDYEPLTKQEYTVWDKQHPPPPGGEKHEKSVTRFLARQSQAQVASLVPARREDMTIYQGIVGGAVQTIIGRGLPRSNEIRRTKVAELDRGDYLEFTDILRVTTRNEELPVVSFFPKKTRFNGLAVVWVDGRGKDGLYASDGTPRPAIRRLLDGGAAVLGGDLLYQGEFLEKGKSLTVTPKVGNNREFAAYTFGYNHSVFASRVHDILTLLTFVKGHEEDRAGAVALVGTGGAGPLVAAARVVAQDLVDKAVVATGGFRFINVKSYRDPMFLPGAVKYGDLPGLLSLTAPLPLWLAGEKGAVPERVQAAYTATKRPKYVVSKAGSEQKAVQAAVPWLLGQ